MTLAQVRAIMQSVARREASRRLGDSIALRMSQADSPAWKGYVKGLRRVERS
ncbi:hypothetical protein [Sphingomonas sp.]|jgi:hypothetical protein|uniref:hypothetical protein n=1 Tax=Sphingomonas sp. TaxID=28214 RepID=UPI002DD63D93|nr:hypothetical protein [Sphingomonas sp.]